MYFPEFSITTRILKNSGQIEAARELIHFLPTAPALEKSLWREALNKRVFHATRFDGNLLPFESVKAFFDGKDIEGPRKSIIEIENYKNALDYLRTKDTLDEEQIKKLHNILLSDIAPATKTGVYRTTNISQSGSLPAPSPDEILALMVSFLSWFNSPDAHELPAPIKAAIVFLELLKIQPFETETKKIAGLLTHFILHSEGVDEKDLWVVERLFDESPTQYHAILRTTQNPTGDITKWVEYFTEGLAVEAQANKDRLINLTKDSKLRQVAGMAPLNDRQERIVEFLHDYGSLQNKDFHRLFKGVSEDTILRDLKDLLAKGIVIKTGSTKSARYSIKPN